MNAASSPLFFPEPNKRRLYICLALSLSLHLLALLVTFLYHKPTHQGQVTALFATLPGKSGGPEKQEGMDIGPVDFSPDQILTQDTPIPVPTITPNNHPTPHSQETSSQSSRPSSSGGDGNPQLGNGGYTTPPRFAYSGFKGFAPTAAGAPAKIRVLIAIDKQGIGALLVVNSSATYDEDWLKQRLHASSFIPAAGANGEFMEANVWVEVTVGSNHSVSARLQLQ